MPDVCTKEAAALMSSFAERTGLTSERARQRYLWTDAFAVCNYLELARVTQEEQYLALALRLVDQVHHELARHRADDRRTGWLSGLSESEGEAHPTRGGLRIGKGRPERAAEEPFDQRLEWDRDGQYFHYLSKWMHALDQVTRVTGRRQPNVWARELAVTACNAFTYLPAPGGTPRMYWKVSIDLSRPLVASMGQHDPLDGYITAVQLRSTAANLSQSDAEPNLDAEAARFAAMLKGVEWATADPLGIGGLLADAYRVYQLRQQEALKDEKLLEALLSAAFASLEYYGRSEEWRTSVHYRLAFRELGLAIGLHAVELMRQTAQAQRPRASLAAAVQALTNFAYIGREIESFWRDSEHQRADTWIEHRDINEVMLATSLAPAGFLVLRTPQQGDSLRNR